MTTLIANVALKRTPAGLGLNVNTAPAVRSGAGVEPRLRTAANAANQTVGLRRASCWLRTGVCKHEYLAPNLASICADSTHRLLTLRILEYEFLVIRNKHPLASSSRYLLLFMAFLESCPFPRTRADLPIVFRHAIGHIFVSRLAWSALRTCCIIRWQILLRLFVTLDTYRFPVFFVGRHDNFWFAVGDDCCN